MTKKALITGITGQDGAYLSEFLVKKGYKVYGALRRTSSTNTSRLSYIGVLGDIELVSMDLAEITNIQRLIERIEPDEIYNLAAQSFVQTSYEQPIFTSDIDGIGVTRILETVRNLGGKPKFYQASTSEMFGQAQQSPQNENTPFYPRSPYGIAKLYSHWMTVNYREAWNMFACSGILFNHESPLRGTEFVTRKISQGMAQIALKKIKKINLGNLNAERDWGFAGDYVEAIWNILQQDKPDDFVISTGENYSIEDFAREAFNVVGLDWKKFVKSNVSRYLRPSEVPSLLGDSSKAIKQLKWKPKVLFKDLCLMMVESDLKNFNLTLDEAKKIAKKL